MDEFRMKNITVPEDAGSQASVVNRSIPRALLQREIGFRSCRPSIEFQVAAEYELIIRNHEELRCELPGVPRSTFLMVFSADGTLVASTHGNHNVYITCATTGHNVKTLTGHPRTPWCIAFHPSSNQILASGCLGGQVRVWDLHGGSEVWNVESQTVIASLAFHPTERLLAIATYNELYFWDWSTAEPFIKCNTANEREKVRYVSFDPMGHNLITGIANYTSLTSQWDRMNVPSYSQAQSHSSESSTEASDVAPRSSSSAVRNPVAATTRNEPQAEVEYVNIRRGGEPYISSRSLEQTPIPVSHILNVLPQGRGNYNCSVRAPSNDHRSTGDTVFNNAGDVAQIDYSQSVEHVNTPNQGQMDPNNDLQNAEVTANEQLYRREYQAEDSSEEYLASGQSNTDVYNNIYNRAGQASQLIDQIDNLISSVQNLHSSDNSPSDSNEIHDESSESNESLTNLIMRPDEQETETDESNNSTQLVECEQTLQEHSAPHSQANTTTTHIDNFLLWDGSLTSTTFTPAQSIVNSVRNNCPIDYVRNNCPIDYSLFNNRLESGFPQATPREEINVVPDLYSGDMPSVLQNSAHRQVSDDYLNNSRDVSGLVSLSGSYIPDRVPEVPVQYNNTSDTLIVHRERESYQNYMSSVSGEVSVMPNSNPHASVSEAMEIELQHHPTEYTPNSSPSSLASESFEQEFTHTLQGSESHTFFDTSESSDTGSPHPNYRTHADNVSSLLTRNSVNIPYWQNPSEFSHHLISVNSIDNENQPVPPRSRQLEPNLILNEGVLHFTDYQNSVPHEVTVSQRTDVNNAYHNGVQHLTGHYVNNCQCTGESLGDFQVHNENIVRRPHAQLNNTTADENRQSSQTQMSRPGDNEHVSLSENSAFQPCNQRSRNSDTASNESSNVFTDNEVRTGIQILSQHIDNMQHLCRARLEMLQLQQIRQMWDYLQFQIRSLHTEVYDEASGDQRGSNSRPVNVHAPNRDTSRVNDTPPASSSPRHRQRRPFQPIYPRRELDEEEREILDVLDFLGPDDGSLRDILHEFGQRRRRAHGRNRPDDSRHLSNYRQLLGPILIPFYNRRVPQAATLSPRPQLRVRPVVQERLSQGETNDSVNNTSDSTNSVSRTREHEQSEISLSNVYPLGISPISSVDGSEYETGNSNNSRATIQLNNQTDSGVSTEVDDVAQETPVNRPESESQETMSSEAEPGVQENEVFMEAVSVDMHCNQNISNESPVSNSPSVSTNVNETPLPSTLNPSSLLSYLRNVSDTLANDKTDLSKTRTVDECEPSTSSGETKCKRMKIDQKKLVKEKVFDVLIRALEDQVENTNSETPNNNARSNNEVVSLDSSTSQNLDMSSGQNVFNITSSSEPLNVELPTNDPLNACSPSSDETTGFRGFPSTDANTLSNADDGVFSLNPDQHSDADEIDRCSTVTNISDSNLLLTNPIAQDFDTNATETNQHDLSQSTDSDCTLRPGTPFVIVENVEHPNILESHDSFLENPAESSTQSPTMSTVSSTLNDSALPITSSSSLHIQPVATTSDNNESNTTPAPRQAGRSRLMRVSCLRNPANWFYNSRSRCTARRSRPFRRRAAFHRVLRNCQEYFSPRSDCMSYQPYEPYPQTRFQPINYSRNEAAGSNSRHRILGEPRLSRHAQPLNEHSSIMSGFRHDSGPRQNSSSFAHSVSNLNSYQQISSLDIQPGELRLLRESELGPLEPVPNPRKRRSHSGEHVFVSQRNLHGTGSDLSGARSNSQRAQMSQSSDISGSGVRCPNSSTLERRRSFNDLVRSKLTEFRGFLRGRGRHRPNLSNFSRTSPHCSNNINEPLSHRHEPPSHRREPLHNRETSTSPSQSNILSRNQDFSTRLRFPHLRPRFSVAESFRLHERPNLFPGYVATNFFPYRVTSVNRDEYLSSRLRSFRLPRMSSNDHQSLQTRETPTSFSGSATSERRGFRGFRNFSRARSGNTVNELPSSESRETSTSESIRNMISRLESLVRQQREQRDILMRDMARERLQDRHSRIFGRLFSRSGREVFESSSVPPSVEHDYDAFYVRNRGASNNQSSDNQENEDDPWEPVRREHLRATRDFTRRRARQVLGMMVDGLTQFFEESGLTRDTPHAVLDEQIYNLYVLLQLALELTDLLLFQIFTTRPQQSESSWVRYAFRPENTSSQRMSSIVHRLRSVIPPILSARRAMNHPSSSLDSVYPQHQHEETRSEIPVPPPLPRRTPPPSYEEHTRNHPRPPPSYEEHTRSHPRPPPPPYPMEGFLAIPTVHVNDVPVSVPSPPPPTRPRPQSPPPSPMRVQYSVSIGNSVDESNNPAFEVWRVSTPNLRSAGRYLHPHHIHNRPGMPDPYYGEPDEEFFVQAAGMPSFVFRGPSLHESVYVSEAPVTLNHRIQLWSFSSCQAPDISDTTKNVVVSECKIHNDASVDISSDGKMLVALLPSGRLNHTTMLGVYSLQWKSLGQCLYATSFDQNAVSVSLSPTSRHLLVGLASRRVPLLPNDQHVMAQIFHLEGARPGRAPGLRGRLIHLRDIDHSRDSNFMSVNCIRWLPGAGQGFVYGTNTGQLRLMR